MKEALVLQKKKSVIDVGILKVACTDILSLVCSSLLKLPLMCRKA